MFESKNPNENRKKPTDEEDMMNALMGIDDGGQVIPIHRKKFL